MRRILKWAGFAAAVLATAAVCAVAFLYFASERVIARTYDKPPAALQAAGPDALARGERLAAIYGCAQCHGAELQGRLFHEEPLVVRLYAPNLTRIVHDYSDEDFARVLRHGVKPDGRSVWVMPSSAFTQMDGQEIADIVAYLRSKPAAGPVQPKLRFGPLGRLGLLRGDFVPEAALASQAASPPPDLGPQHARGRYLAITACSECHGSALQGGPDVNAPDLTIAASYDLAGFTHLMRTGVAADGQERGLMTRVAKGRFNHFTDDEIAQIHAYLTARAEALP